MRSTATASKPTTKPGFNFARVDIAVLRDGSLKPNDKAVYGVICSHADVKIGTAILSVETIAKETNCGKRTAQISIKKLVARGLIEREERFVDGRQIACLYRLTSRNASNCENAPLWAQETTPPGAQNLRTNQNL